MGHRPKLGSYGEPLGSGWMPCPVDLKFDRFCDFSLVSTTNLCFGSFELNVKLCHIAI